MVEMCYFVFVMEDFTWLFYFCLSLFLSKSQHFFDDQMKSPLQSKLSKFSHLNADGS